MSPSYLTADLSDAHEGLRHLTPGYLDLGGRVRFHGQVRTLFAPEDNSKVRAALEAPGEGRVLVVDGGGSMRCALFGGNLAKLAAVNGWAGVLVHGCVRDRAELAAEPVGVKALGSHPMRSVKRGRGEPDIPVFVGGVTIQPGDWLYADEDGVVVSDRELPPT